MVRCCNPFKKQHKRNAKLFSIEKYTIKQAKLINLRLKENVVICTSCKLLIEKKVKKISGSPFKIAQNLKEPIASTSREVNLNNTINQF